MCKEFPAYPGRCGRPIPDEDSNKELRLDPVFDRDWLEDEPLAPDGVDLGVNIPAFDAETCQQKSRAGYVLFESEPRNVSLWWLTQPSHQNRNNLIGSTHGTFLETQQFQGLKLTQPIHIFFPEFYWGKRTFDTYNPGYYIANRIKILHSPISETYKDVDDRKREKGVLYFIKSVTTILHYTKVLKKWLYFERRTFSGGNCLKSYGKCKIMHQQLINIPKCCCRVSEMISWLHLGFGFLVPFYLNIYTFISKVYTFSPTHAQFAPSAFSPLTSKGRLPFNEHHTTYA